jgi:hypothetical protein
MWEIKSTDDNHIIWEIFDFGTESIHLIFSQSSWKTFENLKILVLFSTVQDFSVYYAKWYQFANLGL